MAPNLLVARRHNRAALRPAPAATAELLATSRPKRILVIITVMGVSSCSWASRPGEGGLGCVHDHVWALLFPRRSPLLRRCRPILGYPRAGPFGTGTWAAFADIQTITVRSGNSLRPLLLLPTKKRRVRFTSTCAIPTSRAR